MAYCCHCMTKLNSPDMPFCPECGRKHNQHNARSFELPVGAVLSEKRYLVGKCISDDNFTLTYIGCDLKMDRKVIIKEIYYKDIFCRNITEKNNDSNVKYDDRITFSDIMKQISRECIALTETDSLTNVAKVYDWFSENNTAYVICEFVSEVSLSDRAEEIGGYEWEKFYTVLKPLLESLSALHEKNIYHKNIKPQNIKIRKKLDGTEQLILTDFGFARPNIDSGLEFSQSTPYEPPEQRNRTASDGEYTDIYSAAAAIYYALTAIEPADKMTKNIDEIFPLLKPYRKSKKLPENVYYALKYALQPDFKTRCQAIETFITRLETVQKPTAVKTTVTPQSEPIQPIPKAEALNAPLSAPTITAQNPEKNPPREYVPDFKDDTPTAPHFTNYAGSPNVIRQTVSAENSNDKNKGIIIALTAAVCILLVGIIVLTFLLISKSNKYDNSETKSNSVTVSETSADYRTCGQRPQEIRIPTFEVR